MVSKNGEVILLYLLKKDSKKPSINQLSRELQISVGSAHKILKDFEKEGVVDSEVVGNSIIYSLNMENLKTRAIVSQLDQVGQFKRKKKTKIVCTIGPATSDPETIKQLIKEGMDVVRINGSHGTEESNLRIINNVRKADPALPILLDIPGKKIRLSDLEQEMPVTKGDSFTFTTDDNNIDPTKVFVPALDLHLQLKPGNRFLVDDGTIGFQVKEIKEKDILCKVLNDGVLKSRKGLNFPDANLSVDPISPKDIQLLHFAVEHKLNFVGVSFASNREHLQRIRGILNDAEIKVIAKIENQQGLANYTEIIDEAYGVMLDRGDLGSETAIEIVPRLQKKIIKECNYAGKPIIVATQMLDSMISKPYPTKAEISDVANAVLDGATALMLSAETAVGLFPLDSVRMMTEIINNIEDQVQSTLLDTEVHVENSSDMVGKAINQIVQVAKIDKIFCLTGGGYSARMISRHKIKVPLLVATSSTRVYQRLNLLWGVERILLTTAVDNTNSAEQKKEAILEALQQGLLQKDDTIIITGAVFPNNRKITNLIEIHKVNELLGFLTQNGDKD